MGKKSVEDQFCFTWGMDNLADLGYVPLYQFMLRTYAELGLSRQEMLCIIHLASYHYNSPLGESRPSLATVAMQMGYAHKQRVWEIIAKLEERKLLTVTRRPGFTSIYNAAPFAKAAYKLWLANETKKQETEEQDSVTTESNTPTDSVTPHSNTTSPSVTPDSNGELLQGVTEELKKEEEIETEEMDLSKTWTQALALLKVQTTEATFNANFSGSQLLPGDNGTWHLQIKHSHRVDWVRRMAPIITGTLARITGETRDLEVTA